MSKNWKDSYIKLLSAQIRRRTVQIDEPIGDYMVDIDHVVAITSYPPKYEDGKGAEINYSKGITKCCNIDHLRSLLDLFGKDCRSVSITIDLDVPMMIRPVGSFDNLCGIIAEDFGDNEDNCDEIDHEDDIIWNN